MFRMLFIMLLSASISFSLQHSGSSNSSSPRSPRSPREELQIVGNVDRIPQFDKKQRLIRESYKATLTSKSIISVDASYPKKKEPIYLGTWKRGQQPERTMDPECARFYFNELKLAYLQNEPVKS